MRRRRFQVPTWRACVVAARLPELEVLRDLEDPAWHGKSSSATYA